VSDPTSTPKPATLADVMALPLGRYEVRVVAGDAGGLALLLLWVSAAIDGDPIAAVTLTAAQCRELALLLGQAAERIP
jgi:hypothetical protein